MQIREMMSVASLATFSSVWLAFLSTCCVAWPTPYRRSYQYFPPMTAAELGPPGQWEIAQEPISYEQQEDYYSDPQWADMEAISNLIDMYDNTPPVWGQIVNEEPEQELYELKRSHTAPVTNIGQRQTVSNGQTQAENVNSISQSQNSPTTASLVQSASQQPQAKVQAQVPIQVQAQTLKENQQMLHRGQKEFPLLRPPVKPKATIVSEPDIISAQLNSAERQKKPSPYDTLRKYLSIEDALKKEADKRKADGRHQKRSNFVTEVGSLTGQLNNLKKNMT